MYFFKKETIDTPDHLRLLVSDTWVSREVAVQLGGFKIGKKLWAAVRGPNGTWVQS